MDWQNTPITDLPIVSTSSVTSDTTGFSIPSHQPPSTQFPPLSSPSKPTSSPRSPSTTAFFCHTCKKSFGAEATYVSHQKTARHITAVKELQRKYDTGNERKAKKVPVPTAAVEAARKVLYADSVASTDPALAATVYWSVANVLWSNNRVRETGECLFKLTSVLSHLQTNPAPPTGTLQPPVTLKPSQIVETLYLARIALARLMSIYDCDFAIAMYMDALEGKYRIPFHEMTELPHSHLS
ncbi:hypothetical protein DFJ77DRAFT_179296 [Powellomyces hirtus]|nr:hypothetical protein DFJ77DRAFT_179296 [Powellomyces hirtus]